MAGKAKEKAKDKIKVVVSRTVIRRSRMLITDSVCVDCGNKFKVSMEEIARFREKRIPLPVRCRACRRAKLIELKLKKLTKIAFKILDKISGRGHEQKLSKKQSQGERPQVKT